MDTQRAKEIVASPVMVKVTYNGTPVYMENVNDSQQSCTVHYIKSPSRKLDVSLQQLIEH